MDSRFKEEGENKEAIQSSIIHNLADSRDQIKKQIQYNPNIKEVRLHKSKLPQLKGGSDQHNIVNMNISMD